MPMPMVLLSLHGKNYRPKGLSVLNLEIQNKASLLNNLHKFSNNLDFTWVHLVWDQYYRNGNLPSTNSEGNFLVKVSRETPGYLQIHVQMQFRQWTSNFLLDWYVERSMHATTIASLNQLCKANWHYSWTVANTEYLEDLFNLPLSQ
jgi:hypothetical protein